jgi:hypothetical protein
MLYMHRDAGTLFQLFLRLAAPSAADSAAAAPSSATPAATAAAADSAAAAPSSATPAATAAAAGGTAPALLAERVRAAEYGVEQAEKACGADTQRTPLFVLFRVRCFDCAVCFVRKPIICQDRLETSAERGTCGGV